MNAEWVLKAIPYSIAFAAPDGLARAATGELARLATDGTFVSYGLSTLDQYFTIGTDNNSPVMNLDTTGAFTVMGWINPNAPTAPSTYRFCQRGAPLPSRKKKKRTPLRIKDVRAKSEYNPQPAMGLGQPDDWWEGRRQSRMQAFPGTAGAPSH